MLNSYGPRMPCLLHLSALLVRAIKRSRQIVLPLWTVTFLATPAQETASHLFNGLRPHEVRGK